MSSMEKTKEYVGILKKRNFTIFESANGKLYNLTVEDQIWLSKNRSN